MKILKYGTPPEKKTYVSTCLHCATQFEFERKEAREVGGRNETYLAINCPVCNKVVSTNIQYQRLTANPNSLYIA